MNISQLRWLNRPSKDLVRFIFVPQFDLEGEFFQWAPLHFRFWILGDRVFVELVSDQSKHHTISDTTRAAGPLDRRSFASPLKLEGLRFADRIVGDLFGQEEVDHVLHIGNRDRRLGNIGGNDELSPAFHPLNRLEGTILLVLVE